MDLFTGVDVGSSEQVPNWACIQYSKRGLVIAMHADSFIFLLLILRFPHTVLVNLEILFVLLVMLLIMIWASHDPFRIAGEGHPKIILRYLFFFFRFYLWLLQKHEDLFWFIVYKGMFLFLDFGSWHGWSRDDSCHCVSNSKGKGNLLPTCTMPEPFYYFSF